jgi:tRNA-Thr(GGU) m(6)t(6)A37 methyltransferase TsaA
MEIKPIAYIQNDFMEKFGIPKQAGLAGEAESLVVMEPEYSVAEAFRGLEQYGRIWLIWEFSEFSGKAWSPTIRPPALGGNKRIGVFATRSPHRPNSLAMSCLELSGIEKTSDGRIALRVKGADLMNGTPVYDIKPYLPYVDSWPQAKAGFSDGSNTRKLEVVFETPEMGAKAGEKLHELTEILSLDPRPSYHDDPDRVYGMSYGSMNVRFRVSDGMLTVIEIEKA